MKLTYEQLEAKVTEQEKLIKQLLERIANLEDQLNKNSKNSSKPPSSDQKPSKPPGEKKERRPYHPGASRKLLPESAVTSRDVRKIEQCSRCGSSMTSTGKVFSWQQVELPEIKPLVHQIDLHTCRCSHCQLEQTPRLTEQEQYLMGSRLEALVNLCLGQFRQGHRVVREFFSVLIPGLELSQGLISKVKARAARSLDSAYQGISNDILQQHEAIHVDATGWRHHAKNEHAMVIRSGNLIRFALIPRQNGNALAELMKGRKILHLVSDRGLAASKIDKHIHQYCLAHLIRNICGLAEHPSTNVVQTELLGELHDALQLLFRDKHRLERDEITVSTWRQYGYATWGFMEAKIEEILSSKPGDKLRRSCERMLKDWVHFKVYLRNKAYPMTNNPAEEALRNLVITRKLCFGSRSEYGKQWRASIQSCIETLRRQGQSVWDFLTETLRSARNGSPCPAV